MSKKMVRCGENFCESTKDGSRIMGRFLCKNSVIFVKSQNFHKKIHSRAHIRVKSLDKSSISVYNMIEWKIGRKGEKIPSPALSWKKEPYKVQEDL